MTSNSPAPTPALAPGSTSLPHLLATLTPTLHPTTFIFLTYPPTAAPPPPSLLASPSTLMTFREAEGLTLITTPSAAAAAAESHHSIIPNLNNTTTTTTTTNNNEIKMTFRCRMIVCETHSSLDAVGLMAAVATRLAERGISVNPVSGFFHDYLFVKEGREGEAVGALWGLVGEARARARAGAEGEKGGEREA